MKKQPGAIRLERPWAWTGADLVLDRDAGDKGREQLWICSYFPSLRERADYSLGVEFSCDFSELNALNELLLTLWTKFEGDSLLAAVVRKPASSRVMLYTGALSPIAHDRIRPMRSEPRLKSTVIRVFHDLHWGEFKALLSPLSSGAQR